ncbi:MarR family transcriptional regulator [Leucobacter zeae]|nr:MarR family transcriptional regulator [Leucobacter zeae]
MTMEPTILDRLLAISSLFQADMQRAFAGTALTEARVHALWVLHHGGPSTQQGLSAALGTTPRSVSALVDGLVSAGYAERSPHPTDRRAVVVSLTEPALRLMERMQEDHRRLSDQLIESVDAADRPAFERGVNAVFWRLDDLVRNEAVSYR